MAFYECTFIARPDITQADLNRHVEKFSEIVGENGGKVVKNEYWGLRNLAYRINKNRKGHYVMLGLNAPAAAVNELERNMKIAEDVMRVMTVRVESISDEPSAMMQSRSYSDTNEDTAESQEG